MYIILAGCAQQGSSSPLAASVDGASLDDMSDTVGGATGSVVTFTTVSGDIDITVTATGGDENYSYSWTSSKTNETSDNNNRFSVASTGTTNAARYNTITFNGARPASGGGAPYSGDFELVCRVTDGTGASVDVNVTATVSGITL